jgi:hypothetical protein
MTFEPGRKKKEAFISRHTLHQRWYTCPIALSVRRNSQHRSLSTIVSATSEPPFQPRRQQMNVCRPVVNRFTRQTPPTGNKKRYFLTVLALSPFAHRDTRNKTLFFVSRLLKNGRHFDYWHHPLNTRMGVCYLDCHEAGLCCYLVIHIEKLLCPLQPFCFHLCPVYWLSLITWRRFRYLMTLCTSECRTERQKPHETHTLKETDASTPEVQK